MRVLIAIVAGVLMFSVFFFGLGELAESLERNASNFMGILPWLNGVVFLLYLIAGLFAAVCSGRNYILVGLSTGLLSAMVAGLFFGAGVGMEGLVSTILLGLVLGCIGGAFCKLVMRLRNGVFRSYKQQ